jgi:hypothetical protein
MRCREKVMHGSNISTCGFWTRCREIVWARHRDPKVAIQGGSLLANGIGRTRR